MTQAEHIAGLKEKQRNLRDGFDENLGLRVHRALSWLKRAAECADDADSAFVFYWIAFNAAYGEAYDQQNDANARRKFEKFFEKILAMDTNNDVYEAIWQRFSGPVRVLLKNKYVFAPFWSHYNGVAGYADWQQRFAKAEKAATMAMMGKNSLQLLSLVFDRLYVLRNQILHGGATHNSRVNRAQVQDGAAILAFLVPLFVDIMMDNPDAEWPRPHYPVVE